MKIHFIDTGFFKLDGGAMFGVVPKQLWNRLNPADENNRCTWSMRCLLIETDDGRNILVDTGIGDKQDEKFRSHFEPHGEASLIGSLAARGFSAKDITDVFLTHLHFDHVGGAVRREESGALVPTFPNATYWSNEIHFNWALLPNPREKASFLKENFVPLRKAGILQFIKIEAEGVQWHPQIEVHFAYGHTEAMMTLHIQNGNKKLVYCADVIPSSYHIGLPYVMSYDVRPLDTLKEKKKMLENALEQNAILIFEHDPKVPCGRLTTNQKGRIVLDQPLTEADLND